MESKTIQNPFPVNTYLGPEYFCDREKESSILVRNLENEISTTLVAARRIGKTGLIQHVMYKLPKGWKGIYVDILETTNLGQFLNLLTTSIIQTAPEKSSFGKVLWNFVKSMRPVISFDSLTGNPKASFDLKPTATESNIFSVLTFLEKQKFRTVIAIDEFQQILRYPEKNVEAWLRSRIQQLKNVRFIFSGSEEHLINELFTSPKRPFFRSTQILRLGKIDHNIYRDFIVFIFKSHQKKISPALAEQILTWTSGHTWYVQTVCNRLFSVTLKEVTKEILQNQLYYLLQEQQTLFFNYRSLLTNHQWALLKALAATGMVYQPTAFEFIKKHNLGSSATVLRSMNSLIKYELVSYEFNEDGKKYYIVQDVFLRRWAEGKTT